MPLSDRPIRSFVLRQGRLTQAQARALSELLPHYEVPFTDAPVDLDRLFERSAAKIIEIGFGMGDTTAAIAADHPENDYLGAEVHAPGVGSLARLAQARGLTNLRIIRHDAVEVLDRMVALGSLAGAHVFFPDPWPKKRHHKRRLIQPEFVRLLASRLGAQGYVHLATDWADYAQQMLAVLRQEPSLANTAQDFAPRPAERPLTKFEARGERLGHAVYDLIFRKR